MLPDPRWLLVGCLLVPALAGCMTGPAVQVDVPAPTIGDEYVYDGPAGQLNVTVRRTGQHYDGLFRTHRTVVLNVTIPDPTPEAVCNKVGKVPICYLGEAVTPERGLVVQHWNKCGIFKGERDERDWCTEPRAQITFDGGGLPGGFGAAPFWSTTVEAGRETVSVRPLTYDRRTLNYTVEAADRDGCLRVEASDPFDKYGLQTLPLAVLAGPFVVCDGRALPVEFTTVTGDTYTLEGHRRGDGALVETTGSGWTQTTHPFPGRSWTPPFAVSDREDANLSLEEAHRVALDGSPAYRRLFESNPQPLIVATGLTRTGGSRGPEPGGLMDSDTYERKLVAVAADGRGVNVTVEKTVQRSIRPNETRVVESRNITFEPTPTRATFPEGLADVDDVARVAEAISGLPLDIEHDGGVGPTIFPGHYPINQATNFHFETNFDWRWGLTGTLTVLPWLEPLGPPAMVEAPLLVSADAASGHLEVIEVHRTRMPLDEPPDLPWADGT